jgi:hypothetical protein
MFGTRVLAGFLTLAAVTAAVAGCGNSFSTANPDPDITAVLRTADVPSQPYYVVIHGPTTLVVDAVRRFPRPKQVVQRPRGTKRCQYRGSDLTITAYSPRMTAATVFCRSMPHRK